MIVKRVLAAFQVCTVAQLMTSDNLRKLMAMQQVSRAHAASIQPRPDM